MNGRLGTATHQTDVGFILRTSERDGVGTRVCAKAIHGGIYMATLLLFVRARSQSLRKTGGPLASMLAVSSQPSGHKAGPPPLYALLGK